MGIIGKGLRLMVDLANIASCVVGKLEEIKKVQKNNYKNLEREKKVVVCLWLIQRLSRHKWTQGSLKWTESNKSDDLYQSDYSDDK